MWNFTSTIERKMGIWLSLGESRECLRKIKAIVAENQRLEQGLEDGWTLDNYPPNTELRLLVLIARNNHLKEQAVCRQHPNIDVLWSKAKEILYVKTLIIGVPDTPVAVLHSVLDQVCHRGAVMLVAINKGKVVIVAGFTQDLVNKGLDAGKWVNEVSLIVDGGGGGSSGRAQGGGRDTSKVHEALERSTTLLTGWLACLK